MASGRASRKNSARKWSADLDGANQNRSRRTHVGGGPAAQKFRFRDLGQPRGRDQGAGRSPGRVCAKLFWLGGGRSDQPRAAAKIAAANGGIAASQHKRDGSRRGV